MKVGSAWKCPNDCTRPAKPVRGSYSENPPCAGCGAPLYREGTIEVSFVVGAQEKTDGTMTADLTGLCLDPETNRIVGMVAGTPAARLDVRDIEKMTGLKWDPSAYLRGFSLPQNVTFVGPDSEAQRRAR